MSTHRTRILRFFFFNDPATTEIYPLSLHDALPISGSAASTAVPPGSVTAVSISAIILATLTAVTEPGGDRKSTRLNSSHQIISYAVFCLKKKKNQNHIQPQ